MKTILYIFAGFMVGTLLQVGISKSPQVRSQYNTPGDIGQEFQNVYDYMQTKNIIFTEKSTPTIADFSDGEIVASTPALKVFMKIGADRYCWPMTKI